MNEDIEIDNTEINENYWSNILNNCTRADTLESSMAVITSEIMNILGDKSAHLKPGALKQGEKQYAVSAAVMINKNENTNVFFAQQNFPKHQYGLKISLDHGHPAAVVRNKKPLLLPNTDDYSDFKQILDTSRMGSSIYYPFFWKGEMLGQLICGSQARYTYRKLDLEIIKPFANIAALLWIANDGKSYFDL